MRGQIATEKDVNVLRRDLNSLNRMEKLSNVRLCVQYPRIQRKKHIEKRIEELLNEIK
tara:strand:+ start:1752 stop:1925 length:174 start_codon:yes stop_codon:yes gene_type:complete